MASTAGLRAVIDSKGWSFPRFDDQSSLDFQPKEKPRAKPQIKVRVTVTALIGVAVLGVGVLAAGIVLKSVGSSQIIAAPAPAEDSQIVGVAAAQALVIHVSGAVISPGLVELPEGARVHDAIKAAGGLSPEANAGALNLARFVVDGEHILVPLEREVPDYSASSAGLVSLSLATASELESLSGVGPALAQRIISWREEHGPFRQVEDVLAVSGIGTATLEGFRDQVVP